MIGQLSVLEGPVCVTNPVGVMWDRNGLRGRMRRFTRAPFSLGLVLVASCGAPVPGTVGITEGGLHPCSLPSNCVRSGEGSDVPSLRLSPGTETADVWAQVVEVVSEMPRTRVISRTDRYVHAEVTSRLFRFRDDLELLLELTKGEIQIRSASRIGRSDMGVNRKRVDRLTAHLVTRGLVRPPD